MAHVSLPIAVHIILRKGGKVFLLKRYNTGFKDGLWSLPAGRVEEGESLSQAALREAEEETGVKIDIGDLSRPLIMHHHDERGERIYAFFVCEKWVGKPKNFEPEKCSQAKWFSFKELPENIVQHVKDAVIAINEGKTYTEYGF